jgi:O-antigen/teichoic acid export membrane protein
LTTGLAPADPPFPLDLSSAAGTGDGHRHLLRGSAYSLVTITVGAVTSAVFWLVAARMYPTDAVGRASALFTSLLFVTFVTNLGIPVAVAHFGGEDQAAYDVLVTWGLGIAAASGAVGAVLFVLLVPAGTTSALREWGTAPALAVFAALAAATALSIAVDIRLMVSRRWGWVLVRVAAVGVVRLPLLGLAAVGNDAVWLFLLAAIPPALSGLAGVAFLPRLTGGLLRFRPVPGVAGAARRYAGVNYLATLASDAARFALPVLVLLHVSATTNASFYVAWGVTLVAFLVPLTIGQVLVAEGPKAAGGAAAQTRIALLLSLAIMTVASLVAWRMADVLVSVYGTGYREAARILPPLMAAGVPWAVTSICLADARVRRDHRATLVITVVLGVAVLGPALALVPARGLDGATTAWLGGNVAAAVVGAAVMLRARLRSVAA